jgi:hypothetical protein
VTMRGEANGKTGYVRSYLTTGFAASGKRGGKEEIRCR